MTAALLVGSLWLLCAAAVLDPAGDKGNNEHSFQGRVRRNPVFLFNSFGSGKIVRHHCSQ
jgi:hypothetical protein